MILPLLALGVLAIPGRAAAQLPGTGDSTATAAPPAPNPQQQRYMQGLRTAGRGVAQIKTGIDRLNRARGTKDSSQVKLAVKRLTAYCSAARGFIASGRGQMDPVAYELPTRKPARDLTLQLDSLSLSAKECQNSKGLAAPLLSTGLVARLRAYDAAVAEFRTAIGLPNK
ncbi:MAG TPA: hypothetical protein VFP39_01160 [Gemmatimonadales bacterium]|nr:hypothetical protein [Gemmatimonadales bacterium]